MSPKGVRNILDTSDNTSKKFQGLSDSCAEFYVEIYLMKSVYPRCNVHVSLGSENK
jgi:hypothetical protein